MPEKDVIDADIILDLICELLEIHDFPTTDLGNDIIDGELPFIERVDVIATNPQTRELVAQRVAEAQAAGRAFPLPTVQDLAAARERQLARKQRRS
jgi:hypothetical protein